MQSVFQESLFLSLTPRLSPCCLFLPRAYQSQPCWRGFSESVTVVSFLSFFPSNCCLFLHFLFLDSPERPFSSIYISRDLPHRRDTIPAILHRSFPCQSSEIWCLYYPLKTRQESDEHSSLLFVTTSLKTLFRVLWHRTLERFSIFRHLPLLLVHIQTQDSGKSH